MIPAAIINDLRSYTNSEIMQLAEFFIYVFAFVFVFVLGVTIASWILTLIAEFLNRIFRL
jgi:hypothetical protein